MGLKAERLAQPVNCAGGVPIAEGGNNGCWFVFDELVIAVPLLEVSIVVRQGRQVGDTPFGAFH